MTRIFLRPENNSFPRSAWECRLRRSASAFPQFGFGLQSGLASGTVLAAARAPTLRASWAEDDAERRRRHSHAERGNEVRDGNDVGNA